MKKVLYLIIANAWLLHSVSCERQADYSSLSALEEEYVKFHINTKSGSAISTTYRALLHDINPNSNDSIPYPYLNNSGSYRGPETDQRPWLTACLVDSVTGQWNADSHYGGLRAQINKYQLSFVSPAKAPIQYDTISVNPLKHQWGYHLRRDDTENFYISSPVPMTLNGNHIGGKEVYNVADTTILRERRAKVKLIFKCGNDISSASVSKVCWTDLITDAYFNIGRDSLEKFTVQTVSDTIVCFNPPTPRVITHTPGQDTIVAVDDFYVFALGYNKEGSDHKKAYSSIPNIHVTIGPKTLTIVSAHNFLPQYKYEYIITINTAFISVQIHALPWEDFENNVAISDEDTYITTFSYSYSGSWTDMGENTGTIDS